MKIARKILLAVSSMVAFGAAGHASTITEVFGHAGNSFSATLTLTYSAVGTGYPNEYYVTNVAGSITEPDVTATNFSVAPLAGWSATGYLTGPALGGGNYLEYDNILYLSSGTPVFDFYGLAFTVNSVTVNIFSNGTYGYQWLDTAGSSNTSNTTNPILLTPEPSTLALLGTGFLGIAALVLGRQKFQG